jgi:hypothetical protein
MSTPREDPALRPVVLLAIGLAGLAMCITLMSLGMRSVMDVGGQCAEGGPYVIAQPCPDGAPAALMLGMLGLFLFGGIGTWGGTSIGGVWASVPALAWSGLFGSLGWNFIDYGLLNTRPGTSIEWGFAVPGVLFELMAIGPLVFIGLAVLETRRARGPAVPLVRPLPGAGRLNRLSTFTPANVVGVRTASADPGRVTERSSAAGGSHDPAGGSHDPAGGSHDPAGGAGSAAEDGLDRLERLARLRDRGLLNPDEFEVAKHAALRELEDGR